MENTYCNYCGFLGKMSQMHGTITCPVCRYTYVAEMYPEDQDIFDDELLEMQRNPAIFIQDLLLQKG